MMRTINQFATLAIGCGMGFFFWGQLDTGVAAIIASFLIVAGAIGRIIVLSKSKTASQKKPSASSDVT